LDFAVLTIFPEMFDAFWRHGIIGRAIDAKKIRAWTVNIRDFASGRHKSTDDRPFGGGCGMVMTPAPLAAAIRDTKAQIPDAATVLLSAQGRRLDHALAQDLALAPGLLLVCGRYEGVDERICQTAVDLELSIGDYVLSGGETAAMVTMDVVARLVDGVMGHADSAEEESFSRGMLEYAQYTRPRVFEGAAVPEPLLSGHHKAIAAWRLESALLRTVARRPDLMEHRPLTAMEIAVLQEWRDRIEQILNSETACGLQAHANTC
jgi:tRNA (guanine37-N1)-methyltransferase